MCLLTYLDISHNKIGDRGARKLAKLLGPEHSLQTLNLGKFFTLKSTLFIFIFSQTFFCLVADNHIHANGAMHLGAHLASNTTVRILTNTNLRNRYRNSKNMAYMRYFCCLVSWRC